MQTPVEELVKLGALPASSAPDVQRLEKIQTLLGQVERPITDDEARALSKLFGPDECFGLAWTLLHLIETAPGWPLACTRPRSNACCAPGRGVRATGR